MAKMGNRKKEEQPSPAPIDEGFAQFLAGVEISLNPTYIANLQAWYTQLGSEGIAQEPGGFDVLWHAQNSPKTVQQWEETTKHTYGKQWGLKYWE